MRITVSAMAAFALSRLKPFGKTYHHDGFFHDPDDSRDRLPDPLFVTLKNIPSCTFSLLDSLIGAYGWPYASSAFCIFVLKTFFEPYPFGNHRQRTDGWSNLVPGLLYIVLPLSRSILLILAILTFMDLWKDYLLPFLNHTDPSANRSRSACTTWRANIMASTCKWPRPSSPCLPPLAGCHFAPALHESRVDFGERLKG